MKEIQLIGAFIKLKWKRIYKGIWELGLKAFNNTNKAYALCGLVFIAALSFIFSFVVAYLRKKGLRKPFVIFVLAFLLLLCAMSEDIGCLKNKYWLLFIFVPFGVCFFRSNGLYVYIGMIPFVLWRFWKEKWKVICAIGIVILAGVIYKGPIFNYFEVTEVDTIESLSIPAQQIAAVFYFEGNITEEQQALLDKIVDTTALAKAYSNSSSCSDDVKNLVRETDNQVYIVEHKLDFLKLYLNMFLKNKRIFVKAFINQTYGYWYHRVQFPFLWATYIENNGMGICRDSKYSNIVVNFFNKYLEINKSLFDCFCSVGLFVYMLIIAFFVALQKKSDFLLSYLPILGIWGTLLLATPVVADIRYAYAIYNAVPILGYLACYNKGREN